MYMRMPWVCCVLVAFPPRRSMLASPCALTSTLSDFYCRAHRRASGHQARGGAGSDAARGPARPAGGSRGWGGIPCPDSPRHTLSSERSNGSSDDVELLEAREMEARLAHQAAAARARWLAARRNLGRVARLGLPHCAVHSWLRCALTSTRQHLFASPTGRKSLSRPV